MGRVTLQGDSATLAADPRIEALYLGTAAVSLVHADDPPASVTKSF
jgi:hypothetical protein